MTSRYGNTNNQSGGSIRKPITYTPGGGYMGMGLQVGSQMASNPLVGGVTGGLAGLGLDFASNMISNYYQNKANQRMIREERKRIAKEDALNEQARQDQLRQVSFNQSLQMQQFDYNKQSGEFDRDRIIKQDRMAEIDRFRNDMLNRLQRKTSILNTLRGR